MLLGRWAVGHSALSGFALSLNDFSWWVWHEQIGGRGCGNTTTTAQYFSPSVDSEVPQLLESLYVNSASSLHSGLPQRVSLWFTLLSLVPGWCLCCDVLCDNPGNSCGNSPIATVIVETPLLCSAQVNVNGKSLIISFSPMCFDPPPLCCRRRSLLHFY